LTQEQINIDYDPNGRKLDHQLATGEMRVYKHIQNRVWQYGKIILKFATLGSNKSCIQTLLLFCQYRQTCVVMLPVKRYLGDGIFHFRNGGLGSIFKIQKSLIKTSSLKGSPEFV
jgi:hypothetical protein